LRAEQSETQQREIVQSEQVRYAAPPDALDPVALHERKEESVIETLSPVAVQETAPPLSLTAEVSKMQFTNHTQLSVVV
jgi:hypothetical protein